MKAIVFAGTSIGMDEAGKLSSATVHGPVKRGDVTQSVKQGYDLIGIIDGIFFHRAAVGHREILDALRKNVTIVGGCSMGALRASEMDRHGMIGVGKIYEWYRDGVIEDDDEVAVATNPDTYESISAPLVNIRCTFLSAMNEGIISSVQEAFLLDIAKATHYSLRSYYGIIKSAREKEVLDEQTASCLLGFCHDTEVDIKRKDALAVLSRIKEFDI